MLLGIVLNEHLILPAITSPIEASDDYCTAVESITKSDESDEHIRRPEGWFEPMRFHLSLA